MATLKTEIGKMVVKHKINNAIENSPLGDLELGTMMSGEQEDEEAKKKKEFEKMMKTRAIQGGAVICAIINLISLGINKGVTIAACFFAVILSVAVVYYEFQIEDVDSLRFVQNKLRHQVNEFSKINVKLTSNVDNLEVETKRLQETHNKLEEIAKESSITVERLKEIVKENGIIIKEKKELLQSDIVQSIIQVIFESDRDESAELNDKEINRLILRMKNLPTIKVNEDNLRMKIEKNRSVRRIISLVQDLENTNIAKEDHIFLINEES